MLGNPGSNPIELFWDVVDALDQKLDAKIALVEAAIKRHNETVENQMKDDAAENVKLFQVDADTTVEDFLVIVKSDDHEDAKALSDEDLLETYHSVRVWLCKNDVAAGLNLSLSCMMLPSRSRRTRSVGPTGSNVIYKMTYATLSRRFPSSTMPVCLTKTYAHHFTGFQGGHHADATLHRPSRICKSLMSTRQWRTTKAGRPRSRNSLRGRRQV